MLPRIHPHESVEHGIRRIAADLLTSAVAALRTSDAERVHDARTAVKRVRALLRLLRPVLGEPLYRRESSRLREVGRALSPARDAAVMAAALDALRERAEPTVPPDVFAAAHAFLAQRTAATLDPDAVIARLAAAARDTAARPLPPMRWKDIELALARIRRSARRRFRRASRRPSAPRFHALRKRVKDLGYIAEMLGPVRSLGLKEKPLKKLGALLGAEHDLTVLRDALLHAPIAEAQLGRLLEVLDERRAALHERVRVRAKRLLGGRR